MHHQQSLQDNIFNILPPISPPPRGIYTMQVLFLLLVTLFTITFSLSFFQDLDMVGHLKQYHSTYTEQSLLWNTVSSFPAATASSAVSYISSSAHVPNVPQLPHWSPIKANFLPQIDDLLSQPYISIYHLLAQPPSKCTTKKFTKIILSTLCHQNHILLRHLNDAALDSCFW